jgi:DNA-3-methyladenine glycosylase I
MSIDHSLIRCNWCLNSFEEYILYHDLEWGVPVHDDRIHFEFLILEGAQAGLSWGTILKRRQGYRKAFANFEPGAVARYDDKKITELLNDTGIIRNRLKINSAVNNAKHFLEIQKEFGSFDAYIWEFVGGKPVINTWRSMNKLPATSPISDRLSKDLQSRGFKFVGSTIIYAHMQATGLVNDHLMECFRYKELSD